MNMDSFLESLSHDTLKALKLNALSYGEGSENQVDCEEEVDNLLMMHMSKQHHDEEDV